MAERRMPYNEEAETSVLGAMLLDREAAEHALENLREEDFYRAFYSVVFRSLRKMFEKGTPLDLVTLVDELRSEGTLEKAGGAAGVAEILEKVPTAANAKYYTQIIREKSLRRRMIRDATELITKGYEESEDVDDLIREADSRLTALAEERHPGQMAPLNQLIRDAHDKIDKLMKRKSSLSGLSTGFAEVDRITQGLQNKDLIVLAARPSMGKTSLALNIAANVAIQKNPVAVFSLEMGAESLALRMICSEARVSLYRLRSGSLENNETHSILGASGHLYDAPMFVDETSQATVMDIAIKSRRIKRDHGLSLIVIDYLQLVQPLKPSASMERDVASISRGLKALAKELDVPILLLSQLNRQCEHREDKRPILADLRDSGAIEQDADIVAFIYRDVRYNPETEDPYLAEMIIAKNRNGPTGKVKLVFLEDFTRFENLASRPEEVRV